VPSQIRSSWNVGRSTTTIRGHVPAVRRLHGRICVMAAFDGGDGMGLEDDPFDWRITKDGRVIVHRGGQQVAIVAGARADRLRAQLAGTADEAQQALARVTGNYRRGNERRPTRP